ncbi:hypothetical protein ABTF83_19595, partial [Acinetobacter baumannii]
GRGGFQTLIDGVKREQKVRVVTLEGNPWVAAVDACRALDHYVRADGYVNASMAVRGPPSRSS